MENMNNALKDKSGEPEDRLGEAAVEAEIAHVRRLLEATPAGPSLEFCEDCDEDIPTKRRELVPGCTRCVGCQERYNRMRPTRHGMMVDRE